MSDSSPSPDALEAWQGELSGELERLTARHLSRQLRPGQGLDFTSNDYLGLNTRGTLRDLLERRLANWSGPVGSTGSRLLRGHAEAFDRAEGDFARWTGHPAALLLHSGYAANLGVLPALVGGRDHVFCDRLAHASLLDGIRLSGARRYYYDHDDPVDLTAKLKQYPPRKGGRAWIVSETVFSMDGDLPDIAGLARTAREHGALLYLDEAHAIGMFGPHGAGRVAEAGLQAEVAVAVYPCGKAPGLMGAFVCGTEVLRSFLVNRCRSLIFSTAQPPLLAALLTDVIRLMATPEVARDREHVLDLARTLRAGLGKVGIATRGDSMIVPVIAGSEERALAWSRSCADNGLDARAIRPPSVPAGGSRLRITINATHTPGDIERLLNVLADDR